MGVDRAVPGKAEKESGSVGMIRRGAAILISDLRKIGFDPNEKIEYAELCDRMIWAINQGRISKTANSGLDIGGCQISHCPFCGQRMRAAT